MRAEVSARRSLAQGGAARPVAAGHRFDFAIPDAVEHTEPPTKLEIFRARCEARAILFAAGAYDLHEAVDVLQFAAVEGGLVAELGQDEVQRLIAEAFATLHQPETFGVGTTVSGDLEHDESVDLIVDQSVSQIVARWERDYPPKRSQSSFANCLDDLLGDGFNHAHNIAIEPGGMSEDDPPLSTVQAVEYLVQQGDPQRLRVWLNKHTAGERLAIKRYFDRRK